MSTKPEDTSARCAHGGAMIDQTIVLYHFTAAIYLPSILNHGIDTGDVPISEREGVNAVCLTSDSQAGNQRWARGFSAGSKAQVRLTVKLPVNDPALMKWRFFVKKFKVPSKLVEQLNQVGNGSPYGWFVYLGRIAPCAILEVFDTVTNEALEQDEIDELKLGEQVRGIKPPQVTTLTLDEALRR